MNKKRMILSMLALVIVGCMMFSTCAAKADANQMGNGSVLYTFVKDEEELRHFIDNDVMYSSQDTVHMNEYTNLYKIIVNTPGNLIICPLSDYAVPQSIKPAIHVFSDFKMSSTLLSADYSSSDRSSMSLLHVDAGTYYYRSIGGACDLRRADRCNTLTVYIGFIPDDPAAAETSDVPQISEQTSDESNYIHYTLINHVNDLTDYIDHNGHFSIQESLEIHESGKPYAVKIDEPGHLVLCPVITREPNRSTYSTTISVFSNKDLSSKILDSIEAQASDRFDFYTTPVDAGIYYIQAIGGAKPDIGENTLTLYLGFIPSSSRFVAQNESVEQPDQISQTQYIPIQSEAEIKDAINSKTTPTNHFELDIHEVSEPFSFNVEESGKLIIAAITDGNTNPGLYKTELSLYSNSDLTSRILRHYASQEVDISYSEILVEKGTYYYRLTGGATDYGKKAKTDVFIGFIPTSHVFSVDHIDVAGAEAKVYFYTAAYYDPDKYLAQIRVVPGHVFPYNINNNSIWQEQTMDNAIESHEFIATENGVYTARISGNGLSPYLLTFEVTGITSETEESAQTTDDSQPSPEESPEAIPEEQRLDEQEPVKESAAMTASEMRKYIRMLEDQIEDLGLEIPGFSEDIALNEYMTSLEQVLRDNGYDF